MAFINLLKYFLLSFGIYIGFRVLATSESLIQIADKLFRLITIILIATGFANLFDITSDSYAKIKEKFNLKGSDTAYAFLGKLLKVLIYIVAGFLIISDLGYNIGGLVTGVGLSGVVLLLAVQDIAKSFIGGISILTDKPFEIGDFIENKDFAGTVEDITLRTTRLRDIHNQIIIVPNSKIVDTYIINQSKKEKRRYSLAFTLVLSTSLEKVAELNERIKNTLSCNEKVIPDSTKVSFNTISLNGIDISIACYSDIVDGNEFLSFKEELNYVILGIIQEMNIRLAYNSQTLYVKNEE